MLFKSSHRLTQINADVKKVKSGITVGFLGLQNSLIRSFSDNVHRKKVSLNICLPGVAHRAQTSEYPWLNINAISGSNSYG
jgi:hypothetical protein